MAYGAPDFKDIKAKAKAKVKEEKKPTGTKKTSTRVPVVYSLDENDAVMISEDEFEG